MPLSRSIARTRDELEELVRSLRAFADDEHTLAGTPRVVQSWARRAALSGADRQVVDRGRPRSAAAPLPAPSRSMPIEPSAG